MVGGRKEKCVTFVLEKRNRKRNIVALNINGVNLTVPFFLMKCISFIEKQIFSTKF